MKSVFIRHCMAILVISIRSFGFVINNNAFSGSSLMMSFEPPSGFLQALRSAARMGDANKLSELTKSSPVGHAILNDRTGDIMGLTALHWAIASGQSKGRVESVRILIEAGADIEAINNSGFTPLHYACATRKFECARLLLDREANIEAVTSGGQTPLHCAAQKGDDECIELLLEKGANVNSIDFDGDTPLHLARRFGKSQCEEILIKSGADITIKNLAGELPLAADPLPIVNFSYE